MEAEPCRWQVLRLCLGIRSLISYPSLACYTLAFIGQVNIIFSAMREGLGNGARFLPSKRRENMTKSVGTSNTKARKGTSKVPAIASEGTNNSSDPFIRDGKKLVAAIEKHIGAGADWEKQTQRLLISAARLAVSTDKHGQITGQITPIIRLVEGTLTLTHASNVEKWVLMYAPVVIKDGKPSFSMTKAKRFLEHGIQDYESRLINSTPYNKLSEPPKPFAGFDGAKKIEALLKQFEKHIDALKTGILTYRGEEVTLTEDQLDQINIDLDQYDALKAAINRSTKRSAKANIIDAEATTIN